MKDSKNGKEEKVKWVSKRVESFWHSLFWGMLKAPFKALWRKLGGKHETED